MINVILVDDQKIVREGIKMILSLDEEINIMKEAENGRQLLDILNEVATKLVKAFNSMATDKQTPSQLNEYKGKLKMLTQREMDVAKLVALGKSNKDICHILFLTEGTVKNYLTKIFEKLELTSRTELALFINQAELSK